MSKKKNPSGPNEEPPDQQASSAKRTTAEKKKTLADKKASPTKKQTTPRRSHDTRSHDTQQETADHFPIVGIGASAGGLEALKTFFSHVPEDSGIAYVVVMHLSPTSKSHLAELLQPHIKISVQQISDTVKLAKNHVYVIPPNANLDSIDTHVRLSELETRPGERAPIDHFFRTLSQTHDGDAIGIILSGTGSDGTLGIREIKARSGITIAQDPVEAEFDAMPRNAIATGMVDLILPVAKIATTIVEMTRTRPNVPVPVDEDDVEPELDQQLQKIFARLRARTARDFSRYKQSTVMRRIRRRMLLRHIEQFGAYLDILNKEPDEVRSLADDLLVTVTNFFRDQDVFAELEKRVIPNLFEGKTAEDSVRIWSVGCATGEEAYSLAMLLLEESFRRENAPRIQIFASDLHERSLLKARQGFYSSDIETDVGSKRLKRFFRKEDGGYRVNDELRQIVLFAPHNLMGDPPFSKIDLITCRNLLIYLQRDVQSEVIELFHYALKPSGFLLLGTSETLESSELFELMDKKCCLYRKHNVPANDLRLPVFPLHRIQVSDGSGRTELIAYGLLHQRMVEEYAPPSMLVGPDDKIVHLSEHAGRYLLPPGGEITDSAHKLVRPELRMDLRGALQAVREQSEEITTKPVSVRFNGESEQVTLRVKPALGDQHHGFVLVIFDGQHSSLTENRQTKEPRQTSESNLTTHQLGQIEALEKELYLSRERSQIIIEEYETGQEELKASNEELQSVNEELRSTLEELETGKEELQSMNEELQALNQENRNKIDEFSQLSSDLQNLMAATNIATLFLDKDLRIVRFTPQVADLFNVRMSDRGRPLSDLTHRLVDGNLIQDARNALDHYTSKFSEMQDQTGRWYLVRVMPYRDTKDCIEGVVITFVDITERVKAEAELRISEQRFRALVDASAQIVWTTDSEGLVVDDSPSWQEFTGQSAAARKAEGWLEMIHPDDRSGVKTRWQQSVQNRTPFRTEFRIYHAPSDQYRWTSVRAVPLDAEDGSISGWVGMNIDINAQKQSESTLKEIDRRKNEFLAMLSHELRNPLAPICAGLQLMKLSDDKAAAFAEAGQTMEHQAKLLVTLVDDLLDITRITHGKLKLRKCKAKLADIIETAVATSKPLIEDAQHEFTVAIPDEPLYLYVDPQRLSQVLSNLLNNAAIYTPEKGRIKLTAERRDQEIVIAVEDNGIGISQDNLKSIFEIFSQIDQPVEKDLSGLGIGLTHAKSIVEMMGGCIDVRSKGSGFGSEFTIRLPVLIDVPVVELPPSTSDETPVANRPLRVLIVDDNRSAAEMLSKLITMLGHEVQSADNGQEAIALASDFLPDIVLMDLGMPGMDGYEATQIIRGYEWGKKVKIIALTGWGKDEDRQRTKEAGFDGHQVKPLELTNLQKMLSGVTPVPS